MSEPVIASAETLIAELADHIGAIVRMVDVIKTIPAPADITRYIESIGEHVHTALAKISDHDTRSLTATPTHDTPES